MTGSTIETRAAAFRALHRPGDPFVLANAWDAGSARVLAALGAQAIATTSAGHAFTLGRSDMGVTRDEALAHAADLMAAVDLPVSADLENGFGDAPEAAAQTIRLAGEIGLAGACIEDVAPPDGAAYDAELAVERVRAAAAAARSLGRDFTFTARADGVLSGAYDLDEAIRRIVRFGEAGADVVYAPLPGEGDALARICAATDVPVNALAAGPHTAWSRDDFAAAGVARISLGSTLSRMTHAALVEGGRAILSEGRFDAHPIASGADIDALLARGAGAG